jgi:hypothetical protein
VSFNLIAWNHALRSPPANLAFYLELFELAQVQEIKPTSKVSSWDCVMVETLY